VARHQADRRPDLALRAIATLRGAVDAFFDGVMVMAEDPAVRDNRFALLALVAGLFENIADFSKIST
jgi:glycyl-tRNA synthetase beta chain